MTSTANFSESNNPDTNAHTLTCILTMHKICTMWAEYDLIETLLLLSRSLPLWFIHLLFFLVPSNVRVNEARESKQLWPRIFIQFSDIDRVKWHKLWMRWTEALQIWHGIKVIMPITRTRRNTFFSFMQDEWAFDCVLFTFVGKIQLKFYIFSITMW